jgi:hypothetical protein
MEKETKRKVIHGRLHAYWEQGMEGRIDYTLEPDDPEDRWGGMRPIPIRNGQFLRIFADDGRLLWAGEIKFRLRRRWLFFYEKHDLPNGIWNDWTQEGVPYGTWIAWFWQRPSLHAELTVASDSLL